MSKSFETDMAIWWAKEKVDMLVETYEALIEATTKDIEEAQKKDREYSEGIHKGARMTYKMAIKDLKELKKNIEAIEKAIA